jgi:mRNA interferase MazF
VRPQRWDVWFGDLDPTVGNEQAGDRPLVVVSADFHLRMFLTLVTILPLTTRERPGLLHRVPVTPLGKGGYVITEQIRTISRDRLRRHLGVLTVDEVRDVKAVLARMIDL